MSINNIQQLRDNLLFIIRNKGFSIRDLEIKAGLNQSFVSNFLHDRSKNPGIDSIIKIAEALGVTVDELLGKKVTNKNYDSVIKRNDIFSQSAKHILRFIENKPNNSFTPDKIFDAIYEVYTFSLKDGKFDKEFADWFINSRL